MCSTATACDVCVLSNVFSVPIPTRSKSSTAGITMMQLKPDAGLALEHVLLAAFEDKETSRVSSDVYVVWSRA